MGPVPVHAAVYASGDLDCLRNANLAGSTTSGGIAATFSHIGRYRFSLTPHPAGAELTARVEPSRRALTVAPTDTLDGAAFANTGP